MKIRISPALSLPVDVVTESIAILAKRRAGKSYLARKLVEQVHGADQQVVVLDPKGDWWGLRSAANGKDPGLPFVIVGGEHADVALEAGSGEVVADLVVRERASVLVDLSALRKHEVATFCAAFLEALYRLKARSEYQTPMLLVIDEADAIAPQRSHEKGGNEARMLGAAEDLVRRGGQRGIGVVLVSQRAAVLNKNVLTQAGVLVLLKTMGSQDIDAVDEWIKKHGEPEKRAQVMASLAQLAQGEAWWWAPGWPTERGIFLRTTCDSIDTFDSGRTPKAGETRKVPKKLADVDLDAFRKSMAATIERAKADDPKALRSELAKVKAELARAQASTKTERVEVPVLDPALVREISATAVKLTEAANVLSSACARAQRPAMGTDRAAVAAGNGRHLLRQSVQPAVAVAVPKRERAPSGEGDTAPTGMQRAMLTALAQHPDGLTKAQILLHTSYASSGPTSNAFAILMRNGWATGDRSSMRISDQGVLALGDYSPLPVGDALREQLLSGTKLSQMERAILRVIADAYPEAIGKGEVLEHAKYASSGPTSNAFARLVRYGYVTAIGRGTLRASEALFG